MRMRTTALVAGLLLVAATPAAAQMHEPIDFVTLQNIAASGDTVFTTSVVPHRFNADVRSSIRVTFDKGKLIGHPYFGLRQVSIAAFVDDRPVEVEGYSEVGKDRSTVGSTTPFDQFIANLKALQRVLFAQSLVSAEEFWSAYSDEYYMGELVKLGALIEAFDADPAAKAALLATLEISEPVYDSIVASLRRNIMATTAGYRAWGDAEAASAARLEALGMDEAELMRADQPDPTAWELHLEASARLKAYLANFQSTVIDVKALNDLLNRRTGLLDLPVVAALNGVIEKDPEDADIAEALLRAYDGVNTPGQAAQRIESEARATVESFWTEARRSEARRNALSNLVETTIAIPATGARAGQVLTIQILAHDDPAADPVAFTLARVDLLETGWRVLVNPSFLLVNRVDGADLEGEENYSPSRFKAAPGVSLKWRHRNGDPRRVFGVHFSEEIAFGVNVSYLDFDTTKDVEIGVGPIVGLFNDMIEVGAGLNLNVKKEQGYYFIGLNFAELGKQVGGE